MKAGSLPDDDAVALRESRASPSSGEVCLEVYSRYVYSLPSSLILNPLMNSITLVQMKGRRMPTCYFDRNIFDQIDKKRDITEDDLRIIREAVAKRQIEILVSFETVQETAHAQR